MAWTLVAAIFPILLFYLWKKVTYYRTKQYAGFPQLPPSLLWGHLSTLGKLVKTNRSNIHIGQVRHIWAYNIKLTVVIRWNSQSHVPWSWQACAICCRFATSEPAYVRDLRPWCCRANIQKLEALSVQCTQITHISLVQWHDGSTVHCSCRGRLKARPMHI